jgi:hypothetical protein
VAPPPLWPRPRYRDSGCCCRSRGRGQGRGRRARGPACGRRTRARRLRRAQTKSPRSAPHAQAFAGSWLIRDPQPLPARPAPPRGGPRFVLAAPPQPPPPAPPFPHRPRQVRGLRADADPAPPRTATPRPGGCRPLRGVPPDPPSSARSSSRAAGHPRRPRGRPPLHLSFPGLFLCILPLTFPTGARHWVTPELSLRVLLSNAALSPSNHGLWRPWHHDLHQGEE